MLFVLTGKIQTGKTRWLEGLVGDLGNAGIAVCGVMAPGVWADRRDEPSEFPHVDANGFEKLGIDNVLLPEGERIPFARRADLAMREKSFDPNSQSAQAKLSWCISDGAIERVNGHLASIRAKSTDGGQPRDRMAVIDELGRLELERGGGLVEAVGLLEDGPTDTMRHALVVVREALLPHLDGRFGRWGKPTRILPDERSRTLVLDAVLNCR